MGENSVVSLFPSLSVHAMMNKPCCADNCLADAKLASPKLAKQILCMGIDRTITAVSACCCASLSVLLPSSKDSTVALVMPF